MRNIGFAINRLSFFFRNEKRLALNLRGCGTLQDCDQL